MSYNINSEKLVALMFSRRKKGQGDVMNHSKLQKEAEDFAKTIVNIKDEDHDYVIMKRRIKEASVKLMQRWYKLGHKDGEDSK